MDTIKQLRLPLIVLITFAHSYSGVRGGVHAMGRWLGHLRGAENRGESDAVQGSHAYIFRHVWLFVFCQRDRMEHKNVFRKTAPEGKDAADTLYRLEPADGHQIKDL